MNLTLRRQSEDQTKNDRLINALNKIHQQSDAFLKGRNGDHLMTTFECDLCVFRKLKRRDPNETLEIDCLSLACIRRANLDACWSSASSTVKGNVTQIKKTIKFSQRLGLEGPYLNMGPFPPFDYCGYQVACQMLMNSLEEGKINKSYTQWSTIRKLRTCYANQVRASPQANQLILAMNDTKGKYQRFSKDTCGSLWFHKFARGRKSRMGEEWRTNKAFSSKLLIKLIKQNELFIFQARAPASKHKWMVYATYVIVSYVVSLRGNEGFLLDLHGLHRHWNKRNDDQFFLSLWGKVKGESNDLSHVLPCVNITSSKIPVFKMVERLMAEKLKYGFVDGPAIADINGNSLSVRDIDHMLINSLVKIYEKEKVLFPVDIRVLIEEDDDDIRVVLEKYYSCFRSFRRTSNSRALENRNELHDADIDIVNRWRRNKVTEIELGGGPKN